MDVSEQLLSCKTEQEIRARFRFAPGYYLQAKLEKRRALGGLDKQAGADTEPGRQSLQAEKPTERATPPEAGSLDVTAPALRGAKAMVRALKRAKATRLRREIPDFALPGFEILDAALSEFDSPEDPAPAAAPRSDPELTQQAILAAALEGYSNWPFLADPDPELEQNSRAGSELERKLALVLESEPDLELVLDSESELELALETEPDSKLVSDNVTVADFGQHRAPRTVRVVSVVMDRKRPNMVRVASESTRLAS